MDWLVLALEAIWLSTALGIQLNPLATFADFAFDPMAEFSINQGVYLPNMPTSFYPFFTDDTLSNFVSFPGYAGLKYPAMSLAKPLRNVVSASSSPLPGFRGNGPPRKPKQGRGGKPPPNFNTNSNNNNNDHNNGGKGGPRGVTLDIRGGGYKLEQSKQRPYKAPSPEMLMDDNSKRPPPQQGGGRGKGNPRQRNRRPNPNGSKSQRPRGPAIKNPFFNMNFETSLASIPHNVEFENPENLFSMTANSMNALRQQQHKNKFSPYLQSGSGDFFRPSLTLPFTQYPSPFGLKSIPSSLYGTVKSAATQLFRGRNNNQALAAATQLSGFGAGFPLHNSANAQLAGQLLFPTTSERPFGTSQFGNDFMSQDPTLFSGLSLSQDNRNLASQLQQQQPHQGTFQTGNSYYVQQSQQPFSVGKGNQQVGNTAGNDPSYQGSGNTEGYVASYIPEVFPVNQPVAVPTQSGRPTMSQQGHTSQSVDYPQVMMQQGNQDKHLYPSSAASSQSAYHVQEQMAQHKGNYPVSSSQAAVQMKQIYPDPHNKPHTYSHSPYPAQDAASYSPDSFSQNHDQTAYKYNQPVQSLYNGINFPTTTAYQAKEKSIYPSPSAYQAQDPSPYMTQYPSKDQANTASVSHQTQEQTSYAPSSKEKSAYMSSSYSNVADNSYNPAAAYLSQSKSPYQGSPTQDTSSYSATGANQMKQNPAYTPGFINPEHIYYQNMPGVPSESKYGYPSGVSTSQESSESAISSGSKDTEMSGMTGQLQDQHEDGGERAAVLLPDNMSIYVSQKSPDKYLYQYPSMNDQSSYYYQDSTGTEKGSQDASDAYASIESKSTQQQKRSQDKGRSPKQSTDSSRTSSSFQDAQTNTQDPMKVSLQISTSSITSDLYSPGNNKSSYGSDSYKTSKTDYTKNLKTPKSSQYMIQYSPIDPTDSDSSSSTSLSSFKGMTEKPESRRYHMPVPAQPFLHSYSSTGIKSEDENVPLCAHFTNTTYCLEDSEYPIEQIKEAIEKNRHPLDHFLVDISPSTNIVDDPTKTTLVSYSFEGHMVSDGQEAPHNSSECQSKVYYAKPLRAINTSGQWKIIVNVEFGDTGANYTQTVRLEECSRYDGTVSSCGHEPGFACLQQYKLYRLLAWEAKRGFYIDAFLLPISCFCNTRDLESADHEII